MADSVIATTGGDYTSLNSSTGWESSVNADITGLGPERALCQGMTDTLQCYLSGWTTTASDYIEIINDTGHYHNGVSRENSGTGFQLKGGTSGMLRIGEDYVRVSGIEVTKESGSTGAISINALTSGANDVRIDKCIVDTTILTSATTYVLLASATNLNLTLTNCIIICGGERGADFRSCASVTIDHCGFYGTNAVSVLYDSNVTITNSWSMGWSGNDWYSGATTGNNNASSDGTAGTNFTGTNYSNLTPSTEFVNPTSNPATADFTLNGGSSLIGAGDDGLDIGPIWSTASSGGIITGTMGLLGIGI